MIVKSFQFVPLPPPPAPRLTGFKPNPARFALDSQPDRRYQFEASTNLLEWEDLGTILATNVVINFPDWTHLGLDQCFYRAAALP